MLTATDLQKIAHLAKLDLKGSDSSSLLQDLENILSMIGQIQATDTQGILPMAHPIPEAIQPLREDEVTALNDRELMQSLTPHTMAGLYLVPKVVE